MIPYFSYKVNDKDTISVFTIGSINDTIIIYKNKGGMKHVGLERCFEVFSDG